MLLHGDVGHEAIRRGALSVVLAGGEGHAISDPQDLDRAALALARTVAVGDQDRLTVGVDVPNGASPGATCITAAEKVEVASGAATMCPSLVTRRPVPVAWRRWRG